MTYPVWQTPGGDLGKISANEFYQFHLQAGQSVTPETAAIPYLYGLVHPDGHSRILGWALDGYPIYGPWGYNDPANASSGVKFMASGYEVRSVLNRPAGYTDVNRYPAGIFTQDHEYTGVGDLDQHNGRICKTPDYPLGTYAYFCTWDGKKPVYPYVIGDTFYGSPTNVNVNNTAIGTGTVPITYVSQNFIGASNYDGQSSHWTITAGSIRIQATGTPYHAYGNRLAPAVNAQGYDQTWPLMAGTTTVGTQKSRDVGLIGYWLNGVAVYSSATKSDLPTGFTLPANYTYNLAFTDAKNIGYNFYEDQGAGYVRDGNRYCYTDYRMAQSWYTGVGGSLYNIGGEVSLSLISGELPSGLQFVNQVDGQTGRLKYYIQGMATDLGVDKTSYFTVRATGLQNQISDLSFSITITGNYLPSLNIQMSNLGNYLDCSRTSIQLEAMDGNSADVLTFRLEDVVDNGIYSSGLPAGLSMDSTGLISGVIEPLPVAQLAGSLVSQSGLGNSSWGSGGFQSDANSVVSNYNFSVRVTDGKASVHRRYSMKVYATATMTAAQLMTVDQTLVDASRHVKRSPVMLTRDLGAYGTYRSGEYFSYQFIARDFDGDTLSYGLCGSSLGWENDDGWDSNNWESSDYGLPPGIYLDDVTGWLVGRIQAQSEYTQTYTFGVKAFKTNNDIYDTGCILYTLTVLGAIDNRVIWHSPENLGSIVAGSASQLGVSATALNGRPLTYTLDSGSHLPDGCVLLTSGLISGRPSFQHYSLDHGKTTFDKLRVQRLQLSSATTWDRTYEILVRVTDQDNTVNEQKKFTFQVYNNTYEPYNNLYLVCRPDIASRDKIVDLLGNTDIFEPDQVYRATDPYHGVRSEFRVLAAAGLGAQALETYAQAMTTRHRNKRLYWNQFHSAKATDADGNHMYDVIYASLSQDTDVRYDLPPGSAAVDLSLTKPGWNNPRNNNNISNMLTADKLTMDADLNLARTNSDYFLLNTDNKFYINDQVLMTRDIVAAVGQTDTSVLPAWMSTVQPDGQVPGFQLVVELAYVLPGQGRRCLFNLNRYMAFDIKEIGFQVDRYVLDDVYSQNFEVATRYWKDSPSVTFDDISRAQSAITAKFTVDYAAEIPFTTIDESSLSDVYNLGGIDGQTGNLDGKTMIFYRQEAYDGLAYLPNQGWTLSNGNVVPGFYDKNNTVQNKRAGIWRISLTSTDQVGWDPSSVSWDQIAYDKFSTILGNTIVHLTFVSEVNLNDIVYVRKGDRHGNSYVQYTGDSAATLGYQFPYYRQLAAPHTAQVRPTSFDNNNTRFRVGADSYKLPLEGDRYLKFPQSVIFEPQM